MDVTPALIHKRIQESSGSKYSSSAAAPTPAAPAPKAVPSFRPSQGLGGSQGKVSHLVALSGQADVQPANVSTPVSTFTRPTPAAPAPAPAPKPPVREPSPPPPPPVATRPPPQVSTPKPVSAATPAPAPASRAQDDDRIAPVGTAYQPIKLTPGKLGGRWNPGGNQDKGEEDEAPAAPSLKDRMAAFSGGAKQSTPAPATGSAGGGKKLTWSERQAETKRQQAAEDAGSTAASAAGMFELRQVSEQR